MLSCQRDYSLSVSQELISGSPWNTSDHHNTIVLKILRRAFSWVPIMPRGANLSGQWTYFFTESTPCPISSGHLAMDLLNRIHNRAISRYSQMYSHPTLTPRTQPIIFIEPNIQQRLFSLQLNIWLSNAYPTPSSNLFYWTEYTTEPVLVTVECIAIQRLPHALFEKLSDNSFSFPSHRPRNYSFPSVPNLPHRPSSSPHTYGSWHFLPHKMLLSVNL